MPDQPAAGTGTVLTGTGTGTVTPADARTYLSDFVSDPESLKALPDDHVVSWHGKVSQRVARDVDAAKPKPTVIPDKYDLKLPDQSLLDAKALDGIAATAKAMGLPQDQAAKLVEHTEAAVTAYVNASADQFRALSVKWAEDLKQHPTLGGQSFAANADLAKRVVDRFATPDLKTILNETGYGNHPALFAFMVNVGKAMKEDALVLAGSGANGNGSLASKFYDHPTSQPT